MKTTTWMALLIAVLAIVLGREAFKNFELVAEARALEKALQEHMTLIERVSSELEKGSVMDKKIKELETRLLADEQSLKGYPAPENELVVGKYYQCDALTADEWPDRTEKYLVLQEMIPNGEYWKMVRGNKRLYRTDMTAVQGLVYRFEKTNGTPALKPVNAIPHVSGLAPLPRQPTPDSR